MIKKFVNLILSLIYPDKCIFCQELIPLGKKDRQICQNCWEKLEIYEGGKEENDHFAFVFEYKDIVRNAIRRFKFKYHPEYAKRLADFMELKLKSLNITDYDYIIAVPIFRRKERKRGYNQAQLLADELSLRTRIKTVKKQLIRIKNTKPQSELDHIQRASNVKNAFKISNKGYFKDSKIIIIDDIYTTGSTVQSCIDVLKNDGAKDVFVFALSKSIFIHEKEDLSDII